MIDVVFGKKDDRIIKENKDRAILFSDDYSPTVSFNDIDAVIIQTNDIRELNSRIAKLSGKNKLIIIEGNSDLINRASLESKKTFMLLSPEKIRKSDSLNSKNSGLNQVLCEIARKNSKIIGINAQDIIDKAGNKSDAEKANIIGRIMQNIKLCRKYKCKIIILSCTNHPESKEKIKSLSQSLGFSTQQIKDMEKLIL